VGCVAVEGFFEGSVAAGGVVRRLLKQKIRSQWKEH